MMLSYIFPSPTSTTHLFFSLSNSQFKQLPSSNPNCFTIAAGTVVLKEGLVVFAFVNLVFMLYSYVHYLYKYLLYYLNNYLYILIGNIIGNREEPKFHGIFPSPLQFGDDQIF